MIFFSLILPMRKSRLTNFIIVIVGAIIFISLCITSMLNDSATWDEPTHIGSGYMALKTGEDKLNPEHPRLFKQISAIPLLFLKLKIPFTPDFNQKVNPVGFGVDFLYNQEVDADKILFISRLPSILIALLMMIFVFRFAKYLYGGLAGFLALFLFIFDPNILAHSRYVTNDIYVTCFFFLSIYQLKRFVDEPKISRLIYLSIFSGLTLISKFSGLLLIPIITLIIVIEIFFRRNNKILNFLSKEKSKQCNASFSSHNPRYKCCITKLKVFFIILIILFIICGLIIFADYSFEFTTFEKAIEYKLNNTETKIDDYLINNESVLYKPMKFVVTKVPIPAPSYLYGILWHFQYSAKGHPSFLMGHFSKKGFRSYFPIVFLIKTPIILLFFFTCGIIGILFALLMPTRCRSYNYNIWNEYILILPPIIYFCIAIFDIFNIGYRHILPIIPFCIVIASKPIERMWSAVACYRNITMQNQGSAKQSESKLSHSKRIWTVAFILIILIVYYISGTMKIHPYYLSYFNESIGGAKNGYKYVVDSNIDWGQDLKRLADYLKKNKIEEITVSYFGTANANYYGIKYKPLLIYLIPGSSKEEMSPEPNTPGLYAISVTNLQGVYCKNQKIFDWLKRREPIARIGYSIHIYKVEREFPPLPELSNIQ